MRIIEDKPAQIRAEVAAHFAIQDGHRQYDHLMELSARARNVVDFITDGTDEARERMARVHDDDLDLLSLYSRVQASAVKRKLVAARLARVIRNCTLKAKGA